MQLHKMLTIEGQDLTDQPAEEGDSNKDKTEVVNL